MTRKVIVVSTRDGARKEVLTDATNWGQLKTALGEASISTDNMKAMLRDTKQTLDHQDAVIPEGEFTMFLTPGKVKSGSWNQ